MAKKSAELGHLVIVENTDKPDRRRSPNAAKEFGCVWIKHRDRTIQLMITQAQLRRSGERARDNPEDAIGFVESPLEKENEKLREILAWHELPLLSKLATPKPTC